MDINSIANSTNSIIRTLETNPIIPLIASGGITVWLISNIKGIFTIIKDLITSLISFTIFNTYEDDSSHGYYSSVKQDIFNKLISDSKSLWERTINVNLAANVHGKDKNVTYGFSIRFIFGRLVVCNRGYKQDSQKVLVNTGLRVFFASKRKFMKKLNDYIEGEYNKVVNRGNERRTIRVFHGTGNQFGCSTKNKRRLDSIFTNNNEQHQLYDDIQKFIKNKDVYSQMNYPYKYSALLEGVPGAGKSSTILAIASELNRDVEYINLSTSSVESLLNRLNDSTDKKIFVFEDIDALNSGSNVNREDDKDTTNQTCVINNNDGIKVFSISLSDLLNITDGLLSSDGAICIFTTNHIEKLDPALLRAGRMNKIIKFEYLNPQTANRMIKNYLGFEMQNLKDKIKPAELQEEILNISLGHADESALEKFCK